MASSAVIVMKALTDGWSASIRRSTVSTTSTGESSLFRMRRARVRASISIMARPVYPSGSGAALPSFVGRVAADGLPRLAEAPGIRAFSTRWSLARLSQRADLKPWSRKRERPS